MKIQLLPSTFDENGKAAPRQHLACFVVDDCVAIDAGSLAMATNAAQRKQIRDVVLTHAHLDHVAGLPLFIDDLFATLKQPICVHATREVVEILERDVFNWTIYPRFSELENSNNTTVLKYNSFASGAEFSIKHLRFKSFAVNHRVPSVGFIVSDDTTTIALSGDTAEMEDFWRGVNAEENLSTLLIECAFPDDLEELARTSHHLTPTRMRKELEKFDRKECAIYVVNIKPMYYDEVVEQIAQMEIENLQILQVGQIYEW